MSPGVTCSVWAVFGSATATLQGVLFDCRCSGHVVAFASQGRDSTELRQTPLHKLIGIFQKSGHYSLWFICCVIQCITFLALSLVCLLNSLSLLVFSNGSISPSTFAFISLQAQSFMGFSIHQTRMSVSVLQALFLEVVSLLFFFSSKTVPTALSSFFHLYSLRQLTVHASMPVQDFFV